MFKCSSHRYRPGMLATATSHCCRLDAQCSSGKEVEDAPNPEAIHPFSAQIVQLCPTNEQSLPESEPTIHFCEHEEEACIVGKCSFSYVSVYSILIEHSFEIDRIIRSGKLPLSTIE